MSNFSVVNNIASVNAQSQLSATNIGLQRTLARLSSGLRINSSGDDAAGLAVANKYRSDIAILNVGVRNANDGLSKLQIADGALNNISNLLDRAASLATQSASGTFTGDRSVLDNEFQAGTRGNHARSQCCRPRYRDLLFRVRQQRRHRTVRSRCPSVSQRRALLA
jgi:flagellin